MKNTNLRKMNKHNRDFGFENFSCESAPANPFTLLLPLPNPRSLPVLIAFFPVHYRHTEPHYPRVLKYSIQNLPCIVANANHAMQEIEL